MASSLFCLNEGDNEPGHLQDRIVRAIISLQRPTISCYGVDLFLSFVFHHTHTHKKKTEQVQSYLPSKRVSNEALAMPVSADMNEDAGNLGDAGYGAPATRHQQYLVVHQLCQTFVGHFMRFWPCSKNCFPQIFMQRVCMLLEFIWIVSVNQ